MSSAARALTLLLGLAPAGFASLPATGLIGPQAQEPMPAPLRAALDGLRAAPITAHLAYLTAPERQGRGLGTQGLAATARHLAKHLAKAGIPPLGPSYYQAVPLQEVRGLGGRLRLTVPGPGGPVEAVFAHGATCLVPELAPQTLAAPLVFAGYGIREEAMGHDDFQHLDVKDKIVLVIGGLPPLPGWQRPELQARYGSRKPTERYAARLELLDRLGAKAVIVLEDRLAETLAGPRPGAAPFFRPAAGVPETDEPPLIRIDARQAEPLLAALGVDLGRPDRVRAQAPAGAGAELTCTGQARPVASRNVLAVLRGSDPRLSQEAVLVGAHMDHLGMPGGILHPGADDNASGVAALMEIARAFTTLPRPRRTVVFAFWTGEEDGKFGSGHYVRQPLWPLARTAAYLNLDMIGHPWTAEELRKLVLELDPAQGGAFLAGLDPVRFAEPGFAQDHPELGPVLAQAGRLSGMALHLDPADGRNGGSDYRDFARAGVPWVRFFGNFFPAYHEPGDRLDNLDPTQVQRMARLAFASAWLLAEPPPPKEPAAGGTVANPPGRTPPPAPR